MLKFWERFLQSLTLIMHSLYDTSLHFILTQTTIIEKNKSENCTHNEVWVAESVLNVV